MGDQARQSQELELWPMMGSSGNARARRADSKRSDMRAARTHNSGRGGQIRMIDPNVPRGTERVYASGTRSGRVRTERGYVSGNSSRRTSAARTGTPRTSAGRAQTARTVRPVYVESNRQRTSSSRTKSNVQTLKKRKAGRRARMAQLFAVVWIMAMSVAIIFMGKIIYQNMQKSPVMKEDKTEQPPVEEIPVADSGSDTKKPAIREDFLTISEYNRPGTKLASVKNIFVHYTANPGTSAAQNRSYFENLSQTHERAASAHFIIGYEGEIIQCIPLDEEAYAVIERNGDSISIECCYLEKDGSFTQETYDALIEMLAWLIDEYDLEPHDILRHYDCGGKKCPLYYVEHEDAWQKLLQDVAHYIL